MTHYFLFAGEISGDLHGCNLIKVLKNNENNVTLSGVGGPRMRQEGFDCFLSMEHFQVMGLSDVLKSLPKLTKLFYQVIYQILKIQPDCVILIDYPGFNLRLAKALRKKGFKGKLVQYICPTVWAHGKKRVEVLSSYYDLLLTIYPFEAAYFSHTSLKVEYIGNPLVETIHHYPYDPTWPQRLGLPKRQDLIALFPGSRKGEIQRHLPQQLQAAFLLKKIYPDLCFAISCAQESFENNLISLIKQGPLLLGHDLFIISPQDNYQLMKNCLAALSKSGTVTLELALHAIPTVVHYELSALNYFFAKYILKLQLPHYCIVNLLYNQTVFPELIGRNISFSQLATTLQPLMIDSLQRQKTIEACHTLKQQLELKNSNQCAALAIQELMSC